MRPSVAAAALLAGALALAAIWWLRGWVAPAPSPLLSPPPAAADATTSQPRAQDTSQTPPATAAVPQPTSPAASPPAAAQPEPSLDSAKVAQNQVPTNAAQRETYIRSRVTILSDLAMENDPASLQTILSELTNSERAIRAAALEATIQFGSRDAIPRLKELAATTDDPKEKVALVEAAEFLELPSLTEVRARIKQKKAAQQSGASGPPLPPPNPPQP